MKNLHDFAGDTLSPVELPPSDLLSSSKIRERLSSTRLLLQQTLSAKSMHTGLQKPPSPPTQFFSTNFMNNRSTHKPPVVLIRCASAPLTHPKSRTRLLQEKENKFRQDCTFKPKINKLQSSKNLNYTHKVFNRSEWFNNLTRSKSDKIKAREMQKREKEEESSRNCSFRPSINASRSSSVCNLKIEERLYCKENKGVQREILRREKEDKEVGMFKFRPQVAESLRVLVGERKNQPPLYKRIFEVQQARKNLREIIRESEDSRLTLTFRPSISQNSEILAANKCAGSVIERLSRENSQYRERESLESLSIRSGVSLKFDSKEFVERQKELKIKSLKEREELICRTTTNLSFKPTINQNSNLIASYKKEYCEESLEEKLRRISETALAKRNEIRQRIHTEHYQQFKFEPKINELSRELGKTTDFSQYLSEQNKKKRKQAERKLAVNENECKFTPKIPMPRKFIKIKSQYTQDSNILGTISTERAYKNKLIERKNKEKEIEALTECTFQPKRLKRMKSEGKVSIEGLERFNEIRKMAEKQRTEQKEREKRILYKDYSRDLQYSP